MKPIQQMIDHYAAILKPHAIACGQRAMNYGDEVIRRLDAIHDALTLDETVHRRVYVREQFANGIAKRLEDVPTDAEWTLEYYIVQTTGVTTVRLFDDPNVADLTSLPRHVRATAAATPVGGSGDGVVFAGGTSPTVLAGSDGEIRLQFRAEVNRSHKRSRVPSRINPAPSGGGVTRPDTPRHAVLPVGR